MKKCTGSCKSIKNESEFYSKRSQCKICYKEYQSSFRRENAESTKKIRAKNYKKSMMDDEFHNDRIFRSREDRRINPEKKRAQMAIYHRIESGRIIRPDNCSSCKKDCKPHAHHEDYNKKFDIVFLCGSCHQFWHKDHIYDKNTYKYYKRTS